MHPHIQHHLLQAHRHLPPRLAVYPSPGRIFDRKHLLQSGRLGDGFGLGGQGGGGGRGQGEGPAEVLDIVVKLIVVPAKNVVLLLHMLLVAAEVLPADLTVVR